VAGDFGAAYDRAVQECQWPAVQAPRAAPPSKEPRIVQTGAVTAARFADGWEVRIDAPGFCSLNTPAGQPLFLARAGRQQTPMYDSDPFLFRADGSEEAPLPRLIVPEEIAKVAREAGDYGFMELDGKRFTAYGLAEAADYLRANCGPLRFERIRGVPVFRPTASILPPGTVIASFGTGWTVTVAPDLCKLTTQLGDALYSVEAGSRVTIMDYGEMSFRAPDKEQPRRLARPASLSDLIDAGDFAGAEGTATIFSVTYSAKGFADAARFAAERCPRQDPKPAQR
jgi:hypothetical protein